MSTDNDQMNALYALYKENPDIVIRLSAQEAFALFSSGQLALRHPEHIGNTAALCHAALGKLMHRIAPEPGALRDLMDRGFDPTEDLSTRKAPTEC